MTEFGARSTAEQVLAGSDLRGKRVIVTGASAGLGTETARALVARGAEVVGTARDLAKGQTAAEAIRAAAQAAGGRFELVELDLASLTSVRQAADALLAGGQPVDLVIVNAGVMATPFGRTADGFETQFGTNHLGHFVFVNRLVPLLTPGARVVNLASVGHLLSNVDLEDPNFDRGGYDPGTAYGRSKTANILFAVEFDRRHRGHGVRATAVHPGVIQDTELTRNMDPEVLAKRREAREANWADAPALKSIPQGAATSVWAGVVAPADLVGGRYCENCQVVDTITDEPFDPIAGGAVMSYALDPQSAQALWAKSEELVGERFDVQERAS